MKVAKFKVELKDGLREAYLYVDGNLMPTDNNEAHWRFDEKQTVFSLYWRMSGPTGSSLEVAMTVGAGASKTIVKSKMRASDNQMRADTDAISLP